MFVTVAEGALHARSSTGPAVVLGAVDLLFANIAALTAASG
jgi:hypothetical protein